MIAREGTIKRFLGCGLSLVLVLAFAGPISAAPGDLDTTFGVSGVTTTPIASDPNYPNDVAFHAALQSDGKIVVAGYTQRGSGQFPTNRKIAVTRYDTTGALDTTFGTGGIVTTTIGDVDNFAFAIAVQPDDKIIVAGIAENTWYGYDFSLVRYTANGQLDGGFGSGGIVSTVFTPHGPPVSSHAQALALQSYGKIIAVGNMDYGPGFDQKFALARYDEYGALDATFGTGGMVTTNFYVTGDSNINESATGVAVQADGKIVAAGVAWTGSVYGFALARYDEYGALDATFGTGGMVTTPVGIGDAYSYAVIVKPDGKIVVGGFSTAEGNTYYDFTVVRYNADGSIDTTFGVNGVARADFGFASVMADLTLDASGKIVASGYIWTGSSYSFALARFDSNGVLDATFGVGGLVTTNFGFSGGAIGQGLIIQSLDEKIVEVGYCGVPGNGYDFCLARFEGGGAVVDSTPPVIVPTVEGTLGNNGWYVGDVTVSWTVTDPESTVREKLGCGVTSVTSDTAGTTLTCSATSAGGTSSMSVTIKRDGTVPTATASAGPPANQYGWRKQNVTVRFSGTDALSGGVTCDPPVVLSSEGANQSASGYCYDAAGNQSLLATASGINIDKTPPTTSITTPTNGATYNRNQPVTASFGCDDALSGVGSCSGTVANGQPINTSKKANNAKFTVTATDKAGNTIKQTVTYSVR